MGAWAAPVSYQGADGFGREGRLLINWVMFLQFWTPDGLYPVRVDRVSTCTRYFTRYNLIRVNV